MKKLVLTGWVRSDLVAVFYCCLLVRAVTIVCMLYDTYQAVVALSEDVDSHAVVEVIKSCDGAEVFNADSLCHLQ